MKNVLLLVHDDPGQEVRLQAALDLTRVLQGHLVCLDVTPCPVLVDSGWGVPVVVVDEYEQETRNAALTRRRLVAEDICWSWKDARGDLAATVLDEARTADVVVINRRLDSVKWPAMRVTAGDVLTRTDALILAVDPGDAPLDLAAPCVIAWDGSETAMRTVRRAVPLLRLADTTRICQVGALEEGRIEAREAALYLLRHGIRTEIETAPPCDSPAARVLTTIARHGAGTCVMGGYGHSPVREAIFGGFTRDMMNRAAVPLVIGH